MPTRFPAYRMQDGVTPLAADYFNPVLADLDARIAELEARRADLQGVIDDLTRFGLARIDTLIGPAMQTVSDMIADLTARRNALVAALDGIGEVATQAQVQTAIAAEASARQAAIAAEASARQAAIAAATARPSAVSMSYDSLGRIASVTEALPDGARTTAYTYDARSRLVQAVTTIGARTRTETYTYDAHGNLAGVTATET